MNDRILVSRACDPAVVARLSSEGRVVEAPVLRGVTIWSGGEWADRAHVVTPNWFGVHERDDLVSRLAVPTTVERVVTRQPGAMRYLAKALGQAPGVLVPHGAAQTSVAVVLLPVSPRAVLGSVAPPAGISAVALDGFADLPGAVRFDVDPGTERGSLARYAADLAQAIRGEAAL